MISRSKCSEMVFFWFWKILAFNPLVYRQWLWKGCLFSSNWVRGLCSVILYSFGPPFRQYLDHSLKQTLDLTRSHNLWLELKLSWTIAVDSISSDIYWYCSYYCLRSVWILCFLDSIQLYNWRACLLFDNVWPCLPKKTCFPVPWRP